MRKFQTKSCSLVRKGKSGGKFRKAERDVRALVRRAVYLYITMMLLYDPADDAQAKPHAGMLRLV